MRKLRYAFWAVSLCCLCTCAWAGVHVSGEVWGVWPAGDSIYVDGPTSVPLDKELVVEPGAVIVFDTIERFVVSGILEMRGTIDYPVYLVPSPGWRGFYFSPNDHGPSVLEHVIIPDDVPLPQQVVVADDANLRVNYCHLRAWESCVLISGGRLWAEHNFLRSELQYAHAVSLRYLSNEYSRCTVSGNTLSGNIIMVDETQQRLGSPNEFTCGLFVEGCTNLCMWDNTVSAIAHGTAIGVYFGDVAQGDGNVMEIDSCVVTARSYDAVPMGILNANEGSMRVRRCVVDVAEVNPDNPSRSTGILASNQAEVVLNTCTVTLDRDTLWFVSISGGRLTADFLTRWSTQSSTISGLSPSVPLNPLGVDGDGDPALDVAYGSHVYTADPLLLRSGVWGAWTTPEQVHAYYGIGNGSPCIDAGDPVYGNDPDSTLPDIGRFYFPQGGESAEGGHAAWPTTIQLAPAYPNPFNAATTIPFVLDRNGSVTITVWDMNGRQVSTLVSASLSAGRHQVQFGTDNLASGMYVVRMQLDGVPSASQRLVLLK